MTIEDKTEYTNPDNQIWEILSWYPSTKQLQELTKLQSLLKELNQKVNLTRLVEEHDYWISQILDSLWPIKNELKNQHQSLEIIDVGTGCGLPGIAIAIALPKCSVTLVDSITRKTIALGKIIKELGLQTRVSIRTERIELTGQNKTFRYRYDLATARAVAKAPVLAEYLIPLLNPKGQAILYKGKWSNSEEQDLLNALKPLKGKIKSIDNFQLPKNHESRHVIRLISTGKCPLNYPREIGKPVKKPLIY